jgi:hypothetical protein
MHGHKYIYIYIYDPGQGRRKRPWLIAAGHAQAQGGHGRQARVAAAPCARRRGRRRHYCRRCRARSRVHGPGGRSARRWHGGAAREGAAGGGGGRRPAARGSSQSAANARAGPLRVASLGPNRGGRCGAGAPRGGRATPSCAAAGAGQHGARSLEGLLALGAAAFVAQLDPNSHGATPCALRGQIFALHPCPQRPQRALDSKLCSSRGLGGVMFPAAQE